MIHLCSWIVGQCTRCSEKWYTLGAVNDCSGANNQLTSPCFHPLFNISHDLSTVGWKPPQVVIIPHCPVVLQPIYLLHRSRFHGYSTVILDHLPSSPFSDTSCPSPLFLTVNMFCRTHVCVFCNPFVRLPVSRCNSKYTRLYASLHTFRFLFHFLCPRPCFWSMSLQEAHCLIMFCFGKCSLHY